MTTATRTRPWFQRGWWSLLLTAVVIAGLVIALQSSAKVHPDDVLHSLGQIGAGATGLALVLVLIQGLLLLTRLWVLFPGASRPSWARVARGFAVGQLVNNALRRAGDVLKVLLIAGPAEGGGPTRAATAGVLVVDKVIDLAILFGVLAVVGVGQVSLPSLGPWSIVIATGAVGIVVTLVLLRRQSTVVARVLDGMSAVRKPRQLAIAATLAAASWSAEILALHTLAAVLGFDLGFADAVRTLVMLNLGVAIPLSAANLGTFEVSIALGLQAAGMPLAEGLAIGTAYHAIQLVAIALWASGLAIARRLWPAPFDLEAP